MSAADGSHPPAPISPAEADALLAPLLACGAVVLAISGGADSTALMHLAAGWAARTPGAPQLVVASVDHGLRPEGAAEAAAVVTAAQALGLEARLLRWDGPKPTSGIQAAARVARYRLLLNLSLDLARAARCGGRPVAVATAHTGDDQAETLLMRLARGSGVDGLAGIPPRGRLHRLGADGLIEAVGVLRPLLAVPRARLVATLVAAGIPFVDDPSNRDRRFERVRTREALRLLEPLGFAREALVRTAARMQAARAALDDAAGHLWQRAVSFPFDAALVEVGRSMVAAEPDEVGVRVLRQALRVAGGGGSPPGLAAVEDAYRRLFRGSDMAQVPAFTLGGCTVELMLRDAPDAAVVRLCREPDRGGGISRLEVAPGQGALWDGRYWVTVSARFPEPVEVGPVGDDWHGLAADLPALRSPAIPVRALRGLPALRVRGAIVAVPALATAAAGLGDPAAAARLAGPVEQAAEGGEAAAQPQLRARRWLAVTTDEA